jgi:hypothetical protein
VAREVREYRVEEYEKRFRILVKCEVACGFLWLYSKEVWLPANRVGGRIVTPMPEYEFERRDHHYACKSFPTLERALEQVYDFTPKLHDSEGRVDGKLNQSGIFAPYELDVLTNLVSLDIQQNKYGTTDKVIRTDLLKKLEELRN